MAHNDCGFDIESGRLLVQVFPSRGGGCEMFVTRVALSNGVKENDASVCMFDTMQSMIALCRILYTRGFGQNSGAYALPEGAFALILPEFDRDERLPLEAAVINEFGYRRDCEKIEGYIKEHARPIFVDNAVARLADF
jgi:negative regulator of genetic competence, sporulation and motility